MSCEHDLANPVCVGRAHYICPKCNADITTMLVLLHEAENAMSKTEVRAALLTLFTPNWVDAWLATFSDNYTFDKTTYASVFTAYLNVNFSDATNLG